MVTWQHYHGGYIEGELKVARQVFSPQLNNKRDILVHMPPSYHTGNKRYSVIYMHDGQNLFDAATSYAGEWHVDGIMQQLAKEGIEALIVGIPNMGEHRAREYAPFSHSHFGHGRGDDYVRFIAETVKPLIDSDFRTLPEQNHTGILGSSMGGLISLYGYFRFPEVFGLLGAMSPSIWLGGGQLIETVQKSRHHHGRIYLDIGEHELSDRQSKRNDRYVENMHHFRDVLAQVGYIEHHNLKYVVDAKGRHHEADWHRRLPDALRFILKP